MSSNLDFEAPLAELEAEIARFKTGGGEDVGDNPRLASLQAEYNNRLGLLYEGLTPWQKLQVARQGSRPHTLDYLRLAFTEFVELHGDRRFGDDQAIIGGPAQLEGRSVMVVGHQKGHDTRENVKHKFGMAGPEGYRKAQRLFKLAERLRLPVVTLIDTPGANVGVADEQRGQVEAIASSIATLCSLRVPIISVVIGEGNSGGALAIGVADRILMLEHATYSVASPEGAAAILWHSAKKAPEAATAMKITAQDMREFHIADEIIPEPLGGAHRDPTTMSQHLREALVRALDELLPVAITDLVEARYRRYRTIGPFLDGPIE